ncbi:hypothetical protein BD779DRAFT_1540744 [Infundibulicybe gibba]|nr:hypothetical protein BD779DRAFT_1540744 [Infundibulicybe gibba]
MRLMPRSSWNPGPYSAVLVFRCSNSRPARLAEYLVDGAPVTNNPSHLIYHLITDVLGGGRVCAALGIDAGNRGGCIGSTRGLVRSTLQQQITLARRRRVSERANA